MRRLAFITLSVALITGACKPPPDVDGVREGAVPIRVDSVREDGLHCSRNRDCADWYKTQVPERGTLSVTLTVAPGSDPIEVRVEDDSRNPVVTERSGSDPQVVVNARVDARPYYVIVRTAEPGGPFPYHLRSEFAPQPPPPAPPPPAPKFEKRRGAVLEVEGWGDGTQAVLIEIGQPQGAHRGARGRLLEGEKQIGSIVVEEVYPEGSKARIEGGLSQPVTAKTVAEIEVPAVGSPPAE